MSYKELENKELENTQNVASSGLSGDELEQVRELLFGGIIRDIERQRDELQKDVSVGFAEADQMTNRRLDDVMRRLDAVNQQLERDREERRIRAETEAQKIDNSLIELASEQSSSLAQESQRIEAVIAAETQRIDDALNTQTKRIDDALEALYSQMEADKLQHINALKQSLNTERNRLSQSMQALAETITHDRDNDPSDSGLS